MLHSSFSDLDIFPIVVIWVILLVVCFSLFNFKTIFEFERGILFENGRFRKILGPGKHFLFKPVQTIRTIDIRPSIQTITGQELITSDGIPMKVSLIVTARIDDPHKAIIETEDYHKAIHTILQLGVREIIGPMPIDEALSKRGEIGEKLTALCKAKLAIFGVELIEADVRDFTIPADVRAIFAQVVKARKEGVAALEKARGEQAALRSLANAAKMIEGNPSLMQLRALHAIGESKNGTVVINIGGGEKSGQPQGTQESTG